MRTAVLVSGGGSNLQAIIDAGARGETPDVELCLVLSSKSGVFALERAATAGIPGITLPRKEYSDSESYSRALLKQLKTHNIELVILGGFLSILSPEFCKEYSNKILNVHPSLIPSFCGDGFYGLRVHEAALSYGVKVTGATVHFVNEITDGGRIILQKAVAVQPGDTPEVLQRRVMEEAEWHLLPRAAQLVASGAVI